MVIDRLSLEVKVLQHKYNYLLEERSKLDIENKALRAQLDRAMDE